MTIENFQPHEVITILATILLVVIVLIFLLFGFISKIYNKVTTDESEQDKNEITSKPNP